MDKTISNSAIEQIILSCKDLSAFYPKRPVLDGLNFEIRRGEWFGVIGPNGSGKTTLLKCINKGLEFTGSIEFNGQSLRDYSIPKIAKTMAYLRQAPKAGFSLTAREVASLGLLPHGAYLSRNSADEEHSVTQIFRELGIENMLDRRMENMSGGEQRMVFLAQIILQRPELVLLDEPTVYLDPGKQLELLKRVEKMRSEGLTVLSVFHDINLACRFVSRILVLEKGRQIAIGSPREILDSGKIEDLFGVDIKVGKTPDGKSTVLMY